MNPYIINQSPWTFMPTTQGTGLQDQFNAQALQQMGQLASQAGQQAPSMGMSPMSLADMLRKGQATSTTDFLNQGSKYPSIDGLNPSSNGIGYNFDSNSSYGLKY